MDNIKIARSKYGTRFTVTTREKTQYHVDLENMTMTISPSRATEHVEDSHIDRCLSLLDVANVEKGSPMFSLFKDPEDESSDTRIANISDTVSSIESL